MVIGIISDTHGLLRDEVVNNLKDCDLILHVGDIGKEEVINKLRDISSLEIIKGNCDKQISEDVIPETKIIDVNGVRIYLIHDIKKLNIDVYKEKVDIVIFGHSHKKNIYTENGIIYINPGSVGPRRFNLPTTMAKLYVKDENIGNTSAQSDILSIGDYYIEFIHIN